MTLSLTANETLRRLSALPISMLDYSQRLSALPILMQDYSQSGGENAVLDIASLSPPPPAISVHASTSSETPRR